MKTVLGLVALCAVLAWAAPQAGDAEKGKAAYERNCAACHQKKLGPELKGLFKKRKMQNGQKPSDQNVRARVEAGGGGMPSFRELLSAEEKSDLLAYLKTL